MELSYQSIDHEETNMNDYANNKSLTWENFKITFGLAKYYIFNIAFVYFLEYCIFNGLCDRFAKKKVIDNQDQSVSNSYLKLLHFYFSYMKYSDYAIKSACLSQGQA